jgi:hypothetical protein
VTRQQAPLFWLSGVISQYDGNQNRDTEGLIENTGFFFHIVACSRHGVTSKMFYTNYIKNKFLNNHHFFNVTRNKFYHLFYLGRGARGSVVG